MKKSMLSLAAALALTGCGPKDEADTFREGVPESGQVELKIPEPVGQGLEAAEARQGIEGQRAEFYVLTRDVTRTVNGATAFVLGLVRGITEHKPTSIKGAVATWGPHTDALSPNTYLFTVTKAGPSDYSYVLEAKGKSEADSAFKVVLSGAHKVTGDKLGSGSFLVDWNAMQKLPEHGNEVGVAEISYSHESAVADTKVDALFTQVKDGDSNQLVDAKYKYASSNNAGGNFEFELRKNLDDKPAREQLSIRSRWLQSGAGRADIKGKGGDLIAEVTVNECWDAQFLSRYMNISFAPLKNYGAESVCAFTPAEYATLSK